MKKFIILVILCLIIIISETLYAQEEKIKIASVRIEGTDQTRVQIIKLTSQLRAGSEITGEDIQRSLRRLWGLGIFSHIQIEEESRTEEGSNFVIKVREYPRIENIEINGNNEIKRNDIEDELDLYRSGYVSSLKLRNAIKKVEKLYADKGFLLAEVNLKEDYSEDGNKVSLNFDINEGEKVQIKKIVFYGNTAFDDKILKKQFEETKEDTWWRGADFSQEDFKRDKEKLLEFYRKNGYRDAFVISDSLRYSEDKTGLFVDITVNEGTKYYFGDVTLNGNEVFSDREIMGQLEFRRGDQYNEEEYIETYQNMSKLYQDEGYVYLSIIPREIPVARDTINLEFNIREGNRVRINDVAITGNTKTKEYVIRREITIRPGDMFSMEEVQRSQREITMLNYFAKVEPGINMISGNTEEINLEFNVEEKSTDYANMSAGMSQRDGLIGALGISMNNFFGRGQRFSIDWQFGKVYRSFQIGFTEPWLMGTPTLAGFSVFDTKRGGEYYGFDWRNRGISLRFGREFKWPDDYFRADWIFQVVENKVSNVRPDLELQARLIGNTSNAVSITQIITRDSRDNQEFPTRGSLFSVTNQYSGGFLGGNEDFHKHVIKVQRYVPVLWKFIFYDSFIFGFLNGFGKDSYIPPLDRFFMGGTAFTVGTPLRGYDDRSVGPLTEDGYAYGAKTLLKWSTELRFPILPNPTVFGLIFAEAGNTWEDIQHTNPFDLRRSAGFGFRVFMPMMGLLGLDIGYGFDHFVKDTNKRKGEWKFHFQFGRYF